MSTVYNPTPTTLGSITLPSDGDKIVAASVNIPLQALADGVAAVTPAIAGYLTPVASLAALASIAAPADGSVRHVLGFGVFVFKTSATTGLSPFRIAAADATPGGWLSSTNHEASVTKFVNAVCLPIPWQITTTETPYAEGAASSSMGVPAASLADLQHIGTGLTTVQLQWNRGVVTGSNVATALRWGIDHYLINGATLSTVTARVVGTAGHVGLPTNPVRFGICRTDQNGLRERLMNASSGLQVDPSSFAVYTTVHDIVWTADQNQVIDTSQYSYDLLFWNESGTNALAGIRINSFKFAMTNIPDARR